MLSIEEIGLRRKFNISGESLRKIRNFFHGAAKLSDSASIFILPPLRRACI